MCLYQLLSRIVHSDVVIIKNLRAFLEKTDVFILQPKAMHDKSHDTTRLTRESCNFIILLTQVVQIMFSILETSSITLSFKKIALIPILYEDEHKPIPENLANKEIQPGSCCSSSHWISISTVTELN